MNDTGTWGCGAAALALLLAVQGSAAAQGAKPWRHSIIEAKSDAGIFMTIGKGFAEKQGLKLEIVQFKTDIIELQALLAGDIDSFDGGPAAGMVAAAHGADVKLIGCEWPGVPYGVFVRPTIATPQDLKGKIFAISSPGANPDVVARAVLMKFNVQVEDVRFANLGSDLDRFKAVVAGVADATVVSSEYTPIAEKQGVKMLLRASDVVPDFMRICIFTTGKLIATRGDDAARFMAAEMTALSYALAHREETLALTRETTGAKPDDPRPGFIFDDAVNTNAIDPEMHIPMDKLQWMEEQALRDKVLAQPYDVAKLVDPSVRQKALALLSK
ncbi:MAG TPA: ABC transporter substrate-binding protein [Stellaceae bacterium]|nr:ABC transporter substrate-binding protein [Stellaceae bacterium]